MLPLSQYIEYEWAYLGMYARGLLVFWPPWAWAAALAGWWFAREQAAGPRLAVAWLGLMLGALVGVQWQHAVTADLDGDVTAHLVILGHNLARPFNSMLELRSLSFAIFMGLFYSPILLALPLYVLARRHEEGIATFLGRLRERRAARRQTRADRRQAQADRRALVPAPAAVTEALPPFNFDPASAPEASTTVLTAQPGERVALPGGGFIVINMVAPPTLPRFGRGSLSGFFVGTYYAAATVSKLWLPLALVGLWLFWAPLLAYAEQQAVAAGTDIGTRVVKQLKLPWG